MFIYEVRLKANHSKNYIGQTIQANPMVRWRQHKRDAARGRDGCPVLCRGMRKHGIDSFEFVVLDDTARNQQELDSLGEEAFGGTQKKPQ